MGCKNCRKARGHKSLYYQPKQPARVFGDFLQRIPRVQSMPTKLGQSQPTQLAHFSSQKHPHRACDVESPKTTHQPHQKPDNTANRLFKAKRKRMFQPVVISPRKAPVVSVEHAQAAIIFVVNHKDCAHTATADPTLRCPSKPVRHCAPQPAGHAGERCGRCAAPC